MQDFPSVQKIDTVEHDVAWFNKWKNQLGSKVGLFLEEDLSRYPYLLSPEKDYDLYSQEVFSLFIPGTFRDNNGNKIRYRIHLYVGVIKSTCQALPHKYGDMNSEISGIKLLRASEIRAHECVGNLEAGYADIVDKGLKYVINMKFYEQQNILKQYNDSQKLLKDDILKANKLLDDTNSSDDD